MGIMHFGNMWTPSGWHLGAIWGLDGPWEAKMQSGGKMCQNHCVFLSKVARPTISSARERPDPHQVRSLCIKVGGRPGRPTLRHAHGYPYLAARTPQCKHCLGNHGKN